jgi:hypothetical protein
VGVLSEGVGAEEMKEGSRGDKGRREEKKEMRRGELTCKLMG